MISCETTTGRSRLLYVLVTIVTCADVTARRSAQFMLELLTSVQLHSHLDIQPASLISSQPIGALAQPAVVYQTDEADSGSDSSPAPL